VKQRLREEKKGVEMSMNIIITAAIVLLILVILIYFLGRSTGGLKAGTECVQKGGKCFSGGCPVGHNPLPADCPDRTQTCCTIVPTT